MTTKDNRFHTTTSIYMTYSTIKHIQEFVIILYNYSEVLANTVKFTTLIVLLCVVVRVVGDHLND